MRLGGPCRRSVRSRASPPSQAIGLTGRSSHIGCFGGEPLGGSVLHPAHLVVRGLGPVLGWNAARGRRCPVPLLTSLVISAISLYPSSMAKWMVGATGVAVIAATVVAVVLIERGTSVPRPPATSGAPTGEDPATGQTTAPITEQTPPRSVREGGAARPRSDKADAVTGRSDKRDTPPAPSDAAREETPVTPASLPPELEELRGEPALER